MSEPYAALGMALATGKTHPRLGVWKMMDILRGSTYFRFETDFFRYEDHGWSVFSPTRKMTCPKAAAGRDLTLSSVVSGGFFSETRTRQNAGPVDEALSSKTVSHPIIRP